MKYFLSLAIAAIVLAGGYFLIMGKDAPMAGAPVTSTTQAVQKAVGFIVGAYGQGSNLGILRINQTGATRTLTAQEMADYAAIVVDSTSTGAALTLTLPATSTMTALLPVAGTSRSWMIENNHSAAATTTTIAAGTGIDLQGDTSGDDIINASAFGWLTCVRDYDTDVVCRISETVAAD